MVVVHGLGHEIPCACLFITLHQLPGVKMFRFPEPDDILISHPGRMAVCPQMIQILRRTLHIHVPGIPVAVHGHGLRPPVRPDAEFRVPEPLRTGKPVQGIKTCLKASLCCFILIIHHILLIKEVSANN